VLVFGQDLALADGIGPQACSRELRLPVGAVISVQTLKVGIDTDGVAEIAKEDLDQLVAQKLQAYGWYKNEISKKVGQQRYKHTFVVDLQGAGMGLLNGAVARTNCVEA
jgi:hypothetical protein